ncbi:NnrS family protein [Agrobacterium vitis]|uniref:NnrS family protein n=1 Tax=Rhizobium/Agrobacterium group TaxID=227290 RepID=UPI0012E8D896|nr:MULTISPECIES: NnrS family protein [Rhizobium/Agrobacterium group]MCF1494461.1 NnrS family protein [Allorhizobium ampelinum]MVA45967.1 NnrS family protein [Agrobacterium vitis]
MTATLLETSIDRRGHLDAMTGEGLRLFFPLAALHAALWPLLWAVVWSFDLPFVNTTMPAQWHAQEMIIGSFGAALIGFLTSALPEWTDTPRLHGRPLVVLAGLWGVARLAGLAGAEMLILVSALADQAWLIFLVAYALHLSWRRRTTGLLGFILFLSALAVAAGLLRLAMLQGDVDAGETAIRLATFAFLGLLGLALSRITVPVTNLVLDPTEVTSPYRPHPGRLNFAPGLIGLLLVAEITGLSEPVRGYLMVAAGAAFLDRVAEGFVGRESLRAELATLSLSSGFAGAGLIVGGLSLVGLPLSFIAALHLMSMGGLGLGLLAVLSIAGLLHTGQPLRIPAVAKLGLLLMVVAVILRVAPEFLPDLTLPGGPHAVAALCWGLSLVLWLRAYLPLLWSPLTLDTESC